MTKQQKHYRRRALRGSNTLHLPITAPTAARLRRTLYSRGAGRQAVNMLFDFLADPYQMLLRVKLTCSLVHVLRRHHIVHSMCYHMKQGALTVKAHQQNVTWHVR